MTEKTGIVKWFSRLKRYGFIKSNDGGREVFVQYRQIQSDGNHNLYEGDKVVYNEVDNGKGTQAHNVRKL